MASIRQRIAELEKERERLLATIPQEFEQQYAEFKQLSKDETSARRRYRQNVDDSYGVIVTMRRMLSETEAVAALQDRYQPLIDEIREKTPDEGIEAIKALEFEIDSLSETYRIKSNLSRAKRALRGTDPDKEQAIAQIRSSAEILRAEIEWRRRAARELAAELDRYNDAIALTVGMRLQQRLTPEQAESIADCLAVHKDLTLYF